MSHHLWVFLTSVMVLGDSTQHFGFVMFFWFLCKGLVLSFSLVLDFHVKLILLPALVFLCLCHPPFSVRVYRVFCVASLLCCASCVLSHVPSLPQNKHDRDVYLQYFRPSTLMFITWSKIFEAFFYKILMFIGYIPYPRSINNTGMLNFWKVCSYIHSVFGVG